MDFTLQELSCLLSVASEGSFQAAAARLHRTHPAVHSAIKQLEQRVGVPLLDRSQYRVRLTEAGQAFARQAGAVLDQARRLSDFSEQLTRGEEPDLRVVIGDLTPTTRLLPQLQRFFAAWPRTRLHLHFEALSGPWERLHAGDADLIVHHVDKSDTRLEWTGLMPVTLVPVAAPQGLPFEVTRSLTPARMREAVQVIIRDSARAASRDYFVIEGARNWTVGDQHTKKELILRGMGWGHMPLHMVDKELRAGKLVSLEGRHFKRSRLDIVVARRADRQPGPVARALWDALAQAA
ncbi:MAG TPA: LysR family transcriptional regulator [Burkholderiaceae bacterium]